MASKSRFALVVVLTWKTMLYAQLFKRLLSGLGAPSLHFLVALPDAFNGFLIVLPRPFQVVGQGIVERGGGVLAATLRVLFQLGLTFRFDGNYVRAPSGQMLGPALSTVSGANHSPSASAAGYKPPGGYFPSAVFSNHPRRESACR